LCNLGGKVGHNLIRSWKLGGGEKIEVGAGGSHLNGERET